MRKRKWGVALLCAALLAGLLPRGNGAGRTYI